MFDLLKNDEGSEETKSISSRQGSSKSTLSRQGSVKSVKSAKSVAWSTAASDKELVEDEEEQEKKPNLCLRLVSGMWASREMLKDNKDPQLFVKTTLRELFLYSIFLFIICYGKTYLIKLSVFFKKILFQQLSPHILKKIIDTLQCCPVCSRSNLQSPIIKAFGQYVLCNSSAKLSLV